MVYFWIEIPVYFWGEINMQEKLHRASPYVFADAYFSKANFAAGLKEMDFHLISRFRDDAALYYPTLQKPTGKKGRPKLYDGKIDMANLDKSRASENRHRQWRALYADCLF